VSTNVLIPRDLLARISQLLTYWDISKYDCAIQDEYYCAMRELDVKMQKLQLREAYSKIFRAKDEDARHSARRDYLWQRSQIGKL